MFRRIQTVWFLLAAICAVLCFKMPFYTGDWTKDNFNQVVDLTAQSSIGFSLAAGIVAAFAFLSIFLFRNRKLQFRVALTGLFLSLAMITLFFMEMSNFNQGSIALWIIVYLAVPVFFIMGLRGVRHDINLIRGMDRLR